MPTQPSQSVVSLPLAPAVRHALLCAGVSSIADLRGLSADELIQVTGLPQELAVEVLQVALGEPHVGWRLAGAVTAADLLTSPQPGKGADNRQLGVSTGCAGLDALLGGQGVACGTVTEFYGVPGVGKTQIGMQLAVNVQIPGAFGGLGGKALYIDTEGSFMTDRLIDLAQAAVQRVQAEAAAAARQLPEAAAAAVQAFTLEAVMSNILHIRVQNYIEQLALVGVLDLLLQQQPQVALVVLDSATFHFRQDFPHAAQRSGVMLRMAQQLADVAEQRGVAVVMINQVVTRITDTGPSATSSSSGAGSSSAAWLAPALGEGWGQAAACRVALFWEGPQRFAMLTKAKHVPLVAAATAAQSGQGSMRVAYHVGQDGVS